MRELDTRGSAKEAASCAGYIAKYATKSTEAVGGLMYRLEASDVDAAEGAPARPALRRVRVDGSAATGICSRCGCAGGRTRSGSAGTASPRAAATRRRSRRCARRGTSTSLRRGRRAARPRAAMLRRWHYSGSGYRTLGDAWLAESGRKRAVEQRRVAREELRTDGGARSKGDEGEAVSQTRQGERYITAREVGAIGSGSRRRRSCATTARAGSRAGGCRGRSARCASCGARSRRSGTATASSRSGDAA